MKPICIFNLKQSVVFIRNGCNPIGMGENDNKKYYIKFLRDENFNNVMTRWRNNEFKNNEI